jgi:hypothetical protein
MLCPYCNTPLPDGARECTRCDWVLPEGDPPRKVTTRDWAAVWLSVVPGLGHLYKGHVVVGALIFFLIGPGVLAIAAVVLPMTLGLSLALPGVFMAIVMMHAFRARDRRAEVIERARAMDHLPTVP